LKALGIFKKKRRKTTSSGRHGGCKGEGHGSELSEREVWIPNWLLNRDVIDKDEQSSLPECELESHDFSC
jgi:hypothetical protein